MGVIINGGMNIGSGGISINLQPSDNNITINTYCRVNQNGSININTDPTFPQPLPPPDPNFACVSGIGDGNGTYTFTGDYATEKGVTRPIYIGPNTYMIMILNNNPTPTWGIWFDNNGEIGLAYAGNTQPIPEYPWQETSWSNVGPVITIGQC